MDIDELAKTLEMDENVRFKILLETNIIAIAESRAMSKLYADHIASANPELHQFIITHLQKEVESHRSLIIDQLYSRFGGLPPQTEKPEE